MLSWGLPVSLIASRLRTLVRSRRCSRGDTGLSFSNHDRTSHSSLDNGPPGSDPRGRVCLWEVAAKKVSRLRDKTHIPSICNGRKCPCRNGYTAWGSAQWESTYLGWESICLQVSRLNHISAASGVAYTETRGATTLSNWTDVGPKALPQVFGATPSCALGGFS